ncbi:MAG: GIY-YIG nuclease family protein, partial [Lentisphaerota bacterium]
IDDRFYIGSTCNSLAKRLGWHTRDSKVGINKNRKVYQHLNIIGFENVRIVLIAEFYLENTEQLIREETNYIELYKDDPNCLNSRIAVIPGENRN